MKGKLLDALKKIGGFVPASDWLEDYSEGHLKGDLSAGITVGVMLIPQSMAYAQIAGLPLIYGLYASLVPLLIYALLGTSRHVAFGPTAIQMLIISSGVGAIAQTGTSEYIELAIVLALMTGILEITMGLARFGFLVNFLSRPVIAGFMTAAPILIAESQVGDLVGLDLSKTDYVHETILQVFARAGQLHVPTFLVGAFGVFLLLGINRWAKKIPGSLVLVILTTLASWLGGFEQMGIATVGDVPGGLPAIGVPTADSSTVEVLLPTAVTLAAYEFMALMSMGKAFAAEHDYEVDANTELIAMGSANAVGSFFQSVNVSGSFSRSAVNMQAGAKTPFANIVTAGLIALTLLFLTPLFKHLPVASLAAIIIVASIGMIDLQELKELVKTRRIDGAVTFLTFVTTLLIGVQTGILTGVGASVLVILYDLTRPNVAELGRVPGTREFRDMARFPEAEGISDIHIMRIDARFSFANADLVKDELLEEADDSIRALIIDASGINDLDTTACSVLTEVAEDLTEQDIELYVVGAKGPVRDIMVRAGLHQAIGEDNFFMNAHRAVKEIVQRWNEEEAYAGIEYDRRLEDIDHAQRRLEKERERIQDQRDEIREERKRMEDEQAQLTEERKQLEAQRDKLEAQRQRVEDEQKQMEQRREMMKAQRDKLESEEARIESRQREIEEEHQRLDAREEELENRRKALGNESNGKSNSD